MDSVGHEAARHPTKTHRKEDLQGDRRENGKGTQKGGKFKGGTAETKGKEKGKERRDNVSTKSQNHWNNLRAPKLTLRVWRDDDLYTSDSNSQTFRSSPRIQRASARWFATLEFGFYVKHIESSQHDRSDPLRRTITFGIDSEAFIQNCCSY